MTHEKIERTKYTAQKMKKSLMENFIFCAVVMMEDF